MEITSTTGPKIGMLASTAALIVCAGIGLRYIHPAASILVGALCMVAFSASWVCGLIAELRFLRAEVNRLPGAVRERCAAVVESEAPKYARASYDYSPQMAVDNAARGLAYDIRWGGRGLGGSV